MTCRYFQVNRIELSAEAGRGQGGLHSRFVRLTRCLFDETRVSTLDSCEKTPSEGPCWWWVEKHTNEPDPAFNV